ncbi:cupin domain-containing protein [Colwellia asteriadis]|uniref:Cupin domain-containing protein n=1 Tax=Colwellia asteriadis TaxID=517723 RepID=A0ABN1LBD6_9GAMM
MTVISKKSAEHYFWGDQCEGWHLVQSKNLSVIQERVPSGCSEQRHFHSTAEQFFFILSGVASMELDGEIFELNPNEGIYIPAKAIHKLSNQHESDLLFTVTSTPPIHGDRVVI